MNRNTTSRAIIVAGLIVLLVSFGLISGKRGIAFAPGYPGDGDVFQSGVQWEPFTQMLAVPKVKQPTAPFDFQCTLPLFDGQQPARFYEVHTKKGTAEIVPGYQTEIWGYDGTYPGPLFKSRHNEPTIVRFHNDLAETVTIPHLHGGHQPAQSDGVPTVESQMIPPGEFRDFCYPNVAPIEPSTRQQEMSDYPSTLWYHDHAHAPGSPKGLTGRNVYHGLAGFHLTRDELEEGLIESGVLPPDEFDIPLAIQDRALDA
ncbi:MAG: multicopper oxidase domain-containing protein, partial [Syntrophobacteraceae bacterium]